MEDMEQHESPCQCDVCLALASSGLQIFRLVWDDGEDISDHNYFAFNKTQEDFEAAVQAAKSRIDDLACTDREVWMKLHDELRECGFQYTWQFEAGYLSLVAKPPEVRGFTFEIETYPPTDDVEE